MYKTWYGMLARCYRKDTINYCDYGGRGIRVCERWLKFENFLADMVERPVGTSIDRIDVNGNYEPSNCKWSTPTEQIENRRPTKRIDKWTDSELIDELVKRGYKVSP